MIVLDERLSTNRNLNFKGIIMTPNEKVEKILKEHDLISLASISVDGKPKVRSVDFVMGDDISTLYFITNRNTDKVNELKNNKNVHISVDHSCPSMEELAQLSYIKGEGTVKIAETPEESGMIFGRIIEKFPYLQNLPGDPSDFVGITVKLNQIFLTDNTISFGHTEAISL